jgi:hypothetical protein
VALWSRMHCWSSAPLNPTHWEREDVLPAELASLALAGDEVSLVEGLAPAELPPDVLPAGGLSPVALPPTAPPLMESLLLELAPALGLALPLVLPP